MSVNQNHSYEQIHQAVVNIILGRETTRFPVNQFEHLKIGVHEVLRRREGGIATATEGRLSIHDQELVRDVFWDLFRQGAITIGLDPGNEEWPFFRLSYRWQETHRGVA